ncbi:hypothetical protein [Nostoc sp.]|uniref:hypothetical protein n=1 Tax=Nostoc sp. TaxID=1180 RepID=UPI002FF50DEF
MRLYTIDTVQRDNYYKLEFQPQAGIMLKLVKNVPCLGFSDYYAIGDAIIKAGINKDHHIIPIILQQSTIEELKNIQNTEESKKELQLKGNTEDINQEYFQQKTKPIKIYDSRLHKNEKEILFLKEQALSQDKDIIVLLELPVNDAQPHYKFDGNIEILLSLHKTYYYESSNSISQPQLYVAIVKMSHGSKVDFTYSSPYSDNITLPTLQNLMKYKFEYTCYEGGLYYRDAYGDKLYFKKPDKKEFLDLYSEFSIDI